MKEAPLSVQMRNRAWRDVSSHGPLPSPGPVRVGSRRQLAAGHGGSCGAFPIADRTAVRATTPVLEDPEPLIKVHKLTDLTTRIVVRPWVEREDYWDLTREVKLRLDREGVPVGLHRLTAERLVEPSD